MPVLISQQRLIKQENSAIEKSCVGRGKKCKDIGARIKQREKREQSNEEMKKKSGQLTQ